MSPGIHIEPMRGTTMTYLLLTDLPEDWAKLYDLDKVDDRKSLTSGHESAHHSGEPFGTAVFVIDAAINDGTPTPVTFKAAQTPFDSDEFADHTIEFVVGDTVVHSLSYRIDGRS
jgi:hypothetical protein